MGRGQRKEIYKYKAFIDAVRFNFYRSLEENNTLTRNAIIKKYQLVKEVASYRFRWSNNENETPHKALLDYINLGVATKDKWVEIPQHYVEITEEIIKENPALQTMEIMNKLIKILEGKGEVKSMKKVIAIDLGNDNVKVAFGGKAFSFVNKIERQDNPDGLGDNEYIKMNDDYNYYILSNIGSKYENSSSKKDKNFIPTLNYAIVKALSEAGEEIEDKIEVDLAILTPINQASEKEEYVEKIKANSDNIVQCRCDGKEYVVNIIINNVTPMFEGCSSAFLIEDLGKISSIVDIGSKTVNIAKIVDNKFIKIECIDDLGSFNYFQSLVGKINSRKRTIDNIQDMINAGLASHDKELLEAYRKKVEEDADKICEFENNNNVYFTGGTVNLFKDHNLKFSQNNIKFLDNPGFSNVLGALKMMESLQNG